MSENTSESVETVSFGNDIQNIYAKLCIEENFEFDKLEEKEFILDCIEQCFDDKFKAILTEVLQENTVLINESFVKLIKFSIEKNYKTFGILFINYCDYFDLEYNKTFIQLHEKLQNLIKNTCKNLVGKNCYSKYVEKSRTNKDLKINTLFDLFNK